MKQEYGTLDLESLRLRLKVGEHLRLRDAFVLRDMRVPPFDKGLVFEVDRAGYVTGVGLPGEVAAVDHSELLRSFESRAAGSYPETDAA